MIRKPRNVIELLAVSIIAAAVGIAIWVGIYGALKQALPDTAAIVLTYVVLISLLFAPRVWAYICNR